MCWVSHIRWQSASHLYCLNVSHVLVYTHLCACMYVRWNGERRLLRNSCNKNCVRTCVKICSFICLLVCDFDIFSSCVCTLMPLLVCLCVCVLQNKPIKLPLVVDQSIRISMKSAASCVIYHELQTHRVVKSRTWKSIGPIPMLLLVQGLFSYSTRLNFVYERHGSHSDSAFTANRNRFLVAKEFRYQVLCVCV